MAAKWIETVTGSLEEKRRYRQHKVRVSQLPENYRTAVEALERYYIYFGGISKGDVLVKMLDDLADLFEQAAASRTPVREIVGADPVEFAEAFLSNYQAGSWITREQERLNRAIEQAEAQDPGAQEVR